MQELNAKSWAAIKPVLTSAFKSSMYFSVATVGPDGMPNIMPIGSLFFKESEGQFQGFYLERFVKNSRGNLEANSNVCVMAVNSGKWFWIKSLYKGKFASQPGVRLYGQAGPLRKAEPQEIQRWLGVVRPMRKFKGHDMLWGGMTHGRDIVFNGYELLSLGPMMPG